ncbi:MAG: hypothetical protein GXO01_04485 [Epsilonproteobacteria bacterium]|nr:hypothetical protein [Campylobacterota bacterium]
MKKLILGAMIASSMLMAENFANIKITNDTIEVNAQYKVDPQNNIFARGTFLYNDNDNRYNFYSVGVKGEGNLIGIDLDNVKFSLIMDFVHTKNNSALPIGIGVNSFIPNMQIPTFVRGEYEFAPKVLSFDDADRFSRLYIEGGVQPIENAEIFAGYRNISFNSNYDSSFYIGAGFNF